MKYQYNDGGRSAEGWKGSAHDCVVRAISIATEKPYQEVYDNLNSLRSYMNQTKRVYGSSSRNGTHRIVYERYLKSLGWIFVPTMFIGSGCKVHLKDGQLPMGRIICRVSKHLVAVIDGVINDTFDPSRNGTRCVYGYYKKGE